MADFNAISPSDANFLNKMIKEATAEEAYEATEMSWQRLQVEAYNFLVALEQLQTQRYLDTRASLKELINGDPESSNYIENYRRGKEAQFLQAQYLLAFNFDAKLTAFLDDLPKKAVYVYVDNTGMITTFEMSMAELAKRASATGRLNIGKKGLMSGDRTNLEDQNIFDPEHIAHARAAFMGANARLNRYYEKVGKTGAQAQGGLLMWKLSSEWFIARVTNRGDLKEAYVSALMAQHKSAQDVLCNIDIGSPKYYSHGLIAAFFNSHISGVTNKPAIVEEDIITNAGQYAVKGSRAVLPGLEQYRQTAERIVSSKNIFTPASLKAEIEKMFPQDASRNKILAHGERITEDALHKLGLDRKTFRSIKTTIGI